MKRFILILTLFLVGGWLFTASAQDSEKPQIIESISVSVEKDKVEQVVFKLSGPFTPKIFQLDGDNPRLVLDFFNVGYQSQAERIETDDGNIITGIRVGKHKDPAKTRVVVDIQKNRPYSYSQTLNMVNNTLVVTFTPGPDGVTSTAAKPPRISVERPKLVRSPAQPEIESKAPARAEDSQEPAKTESGAETRKVAVIAANSSKKIVKPTGPKPDTKKSADAPVKPTEQQGKKKDDQATIAADSSKKIIRPKELKPDTTKSPDALAKPAERQGKEKDTQTTAVTQVEDKKIKSTDAEADQSVEEVDPVVLDISFEKSINNSETVLFRLNQFYPPLVFGVEKGEPRVVCDFIDARIDENIPSTIEAGGHFVNRIEITTDSDPDKVRVELILVPNRHYDLQQLFFKEDNLFVVIVNEMSDKEEKTES